MDAHVELRADQVRRMRCQALLLAGPDGAVGPPQRTPGAIAQWFGAMQAQDLGSGKWSLGTRIPGATSADIDAAFARGEVLRTWPMRGTVHVVPPRDARWMVELMGPRALAGASARRAHLGLTREQVDRAAEVLAAALAGGRRATRAQCVALMAEAGIPTAGQLAYHLLWYVSQLGVTCMGPNEGSEGTFVLLDEWAPDPYRPDREEGLGIMALRYFRSHGPTTATDLAGWLGLGVREARAGIAAAGEQLVTATCQGARVHLTPQLLETAGAAGAPPAGEARWEVQALPGFDEFLLGFKDRSLLLAPEHAQAVIPGGNGVFQPTLVRDGIVIGTWRRTTRKRTVDLRPTLFAGTPPTRSPLRRAVEQALARYATYLGLDPEVTWPA